MTGLANAPQPLEVLAGSAKARAFDAVYVGHRDPKRVGAVKHHAPIGAEGPGKMGNSALEFWEDPLPWYVGMGLWPHRGRDKDRACLWARWARW